MFEKHSSLCCMKNSSVNMLVGFLPFQTILFLQQLIINAGNKVNAALVLPNYDKGPGTAMKVTSSAHKLGKQVSGIVFYTHYSFNQKRLRWSICRERDRVDCSEKGATPAMATFSFSEKSSACLEQISAEAKEHLSWFSSYICK